MASRCPDSLSKPNNRFQAGSNGGYEGCLHPCKPVGSSAARGRRPDSAAARPAGEGVSSELGDGGVARRGRLCAFTVVDDDCRSPHSGSVGVFCRDGGGWRTRCRCVCTHRSGARARPDPCRTVPRRARVAPARFGGWAVPDMGRPTGFGVSGSGRLSPGGRVGAPSRQPRRVGGTGRGRCFWGVFSAYPMKGFYVTAPSCQGMNSSRPRSRSSLQVSRPEATARTASKIWSPASVMVSEPVTMPPVSRSMSSLIRW
jgi:hypothetical protein